MLSPSQAPKIEAEFNPTISIRPGCVPWGGTEEIYGDPIISDLSEMGEHPSVADLVVCIWGSRRSRILIGSA